MLRMGFLSFFFLVPLGFCAAVYSSAAAWLGFIFAALGNSVVSAGFSSGVAGSGFEILYFTVVGLGFTWIMAGSPPVYTLPRIRTVYRLAAASVFGSFVILGMLYSFGRDENFIALVYSQIERISAGFIASTGADAVQLSTLERLFTPERMIETFSSIAIRGGALVSMFFLFFMSRQTSFFLARVFSRVRFFRKNVPDNPGSNGRGDLIHFHVPQRAIWVLSLCLPVIVIFRVISLHIVEIAAWNLLVICITMFLAQGAGIVLYNLTHRPMPPVMRLLLVILCVFAVFSPGLNILAIGVVVILGIAENWLPLRRGKS
jgi:hypothetical protein